MKAIAECLYERGKSRVKYVRRRIPAALRAAYPPTETHVLRSLGTSDLAVAKARLHVELARIEAEFADKRQRLMTERASLAARRIAKLTDEQLQCLARFWLREVLLADEQRREEGLEDEEFAEMGERLTEQRAELGRMLAQGTTAGILPALRGFLFLCGVDFDPDQQEAKRSSRVFLSALVETLDYQLRRQRGDVVKTDAVAPPCEHPVRIAFPETARKPAAVHGWNEVFEEWKEFVRGRPKTTTVASQTPWRNLIRVAEAQGIHSPADVTPKLMSEFVEDMRARGLSVKTVNERISKVRAIYKIACGKLLLSSNPAAATLGFKENSVKSRRKRRLPFDANDLILIFGSEVYTQHKRSRGQSGEATFWLPLLMFYTGARPEELAGLALMDLLQDPQHGLYLNLVDRPSGEDRDLFDDDDDDEVPESHRRTLKNGSSGRRIPVVPQLVQLGLLGYIEWLRADGETMLFPTLRKDWHGKLSGSFSKFFGRYKRVLGITDKRKVLYSFRHTMKDLLEDAGVPSKYLKRALGHTSGDGAVTDGYGSDLPLDRMVQHFAHIKFPAIPALPWEPGRGFVTLKEDERD